MLFTCAPQSCAARRPASRKTVKSGNKTLSVDLHCHIHTPPADELAEKTGKLADPILRYGDQRTMEQQRKLRAQLDRKLTSIEQRLRDMDKMGIDVQAISTSPLQYYYGVDGDAGREIARLINDRLAEMVAAHPDRFVALGTLPMQEPELALEELTRCMKDRGFRGIEIGTNVRGLELADERYEKLFAKAQELNAVIFLHPVGFTEAKRLTRHFLTNVDRQSARYDHRARASRFRRRAGALSAIEDRRGARRRLPRPLPGADGSCLQRCVPSATTSSSGRRPTT